MYILLYIHPIIDRYVYIRLMWMTSSWCTFIHNIYTYIHFCLNFIDNYDNGNHEWNSSVKFHAYFYSSTSRNLFSFNFNSSFFSCISLLFVTHLFFFSSLLITQLCIIYTTNVFIESMLYINYFSTICKNKWISNHLSYS